MNKEDFSNKEWTLEKKAETNIETVATVKARWLYHCERCNLDHNRKKTLNIEALLIRLKLRLQLAKEINEDKEKNKKTKEHKKNKNKRTKEKDQEYHQRSDSTGEI